MKRSMIKSFEISWISEGLFVSALIWYKELWRSHGWGYRIRRPNPNCSIIDQSYYHQADAKSLFLNSSFTTFFQISTSVLPTPIAVTSMPRATILWDHTHARAKQDTQEMEEHALVSRFELFKRKEIMFLIPESWFTRVQKKRVFGRSDNNNDNNNRTNYHYHFTIANLVE